MSTGSNNNSQIILAVPPKPQVEHFKKVFPYLALTTLSILQIICGALAILNQIILFGITYSYFGRRNYNPVSTFGTGIWTGFFFALSGSIGFLAKTRPSFNSFIALMIMSIISSLMCLPLLVLSGIGLNDNRTFYELKILFGFQIMISLIQAVVSITTSAFCCRAVYGYKSSNKGVGNQERS